MTKFAAYDGLSIYAVADTAEAAIAKARRDTMEPDAEFDTAPITDEFAAWIEDNGWDGIHRSFEVGEDGYLRDATVE